MDRLYRATINTWNGLKSAIRTEAAFRQEIAVLLVAIPLAYLVGQTAWRSWQRTWG
jgi:diacylglycerol kinase (ATP)